jgi:EAL domain-containing protein (putative c-di-GMP-specific phosphodiesterase class I)/GGDEF domain-containing protein
MSTMQLFEWLGAHLRAIRIAVAPLLAVMIVGIYVLVYATGGIKFVYSHSMYLAILLSGFIFGVRGGLIVGLIGGITLGPFMPIDVATGEQQNTINWLYRTGFFMLVGIACGGASDSVRSYLRHLKWIARHDAATQLPNRNALLESLSDIPKIKNTSHLHVLVVVSLQNAMELKSAFGFDIIEAVIQQSAHRYQSILQDKAQVYRIDPEQLGILIENRDVQAIESLLAELVKGAQQPYQFNDIPIHVDSRLGYVTFNKVIQAPEQYLQRAESALISANEKVLDCVAYSPEISNFAKENLSILGNLMSALKEGQLSMHYQPKISIKTGEIHSVEALMRWKHPERGNIPPAIFIPRAEQSTLINLITEFALEQAMEQIVKWRQHDIHLPIAVNISPRNLLQPGFSDLVLHLLQRYGVSGQSLELEVTEGALMTDIARTIVELSRLADAKITISIDDFGTGYSSLQYLHQLPISLIKIDQSFVRRLPDDKGAVHIVEAAVTLAHKMGMKTIAEGVEDQSAYKLLADLGCDIAQGFMISRPLPAAEFEKWLAQYEGNALYAQM